MFSVKHNECVGFESRWKVTKLSASTSTQTTEFSVAEKGCSTTEQHSQEAQTQNTNQQTLEEAEVDMDKLAQWLNKIYPKVIEQIDKANNSKVFRGYRLACQNADSTCKLVQTLNVASKIEEDSKAIPIVSSLEWNSSGKYLAVVYSYKHKTWCHHTGVVSIYHLNRDDVLSETPKKRLSTESCITTVKFHPTFGTVLSAATFTGHIYLWNTENDVDPLICSIVAHDEYITRLSWVHDIDLYKTVCLASAGIDGLLKMWNFNIADNILKIKTIYKFKVPILGKINHSTEISKDLLDKTDLGVVCFDFSKFIPDLFVVALEGGLVARCSVLGITKIKNNENDVPFYDAVFKYYEPHKGEIVALKFSPHQKDMFLTSGTDGEIRIYILDQDEPAQVIFTNFPLSDVTYVLHEEKLIAACGHDGVVEVFHLINGKSVPLTFNVKITRRSLASIAVNGSKTNYVVTGNNVGELQLWNIPWQSIEYQSRK